MKPAVEKKSYRLCQITWCLLGLLIIAAINLYQRGFRLEYFLQIMPPCIFRTITGFYCPGCGGTRAVLELIHGNFFHSFYYHPIVLYTVVLYGWYLISNTIQWLSRGRIPWGSRYHRWYGLVAVIIVIGNWILKNLLLFWGIARL